MEVKLIAMTDAVMPKKENELVGEFCTAEHVCDHAARTCTSAELEPMLEYEDTYLSWGHEGLGALEASLRSGHESILEHAVYSFEIKGVSRVLLAQLSRHRLMSLSVQSQRYVKIDDPCCILPQSIKKAVQTELYNGGGWSPNGCLEESLEEYKTVLKECVERMRKLGVPEEDIRYLYPQGIVTNLVLTANARELKHIFALRTCGRAQWEIRELADKMLEICKEVSPTIFADAGPRCVQLGYCPEAKGCGHMPKKEMKE